MSNAAANETLTSKQHAVILNSVRSDCSKIRQALDRMKVDAEKLKGSPSGDILGDSITVMSVGLRHVSEVFRIQI